MVPRYLTGAISEAPTHRNCLIPAIGRNTGVRFLQSPTTGLGRGRVETEILRDHAVSAARKRMGERRPRYARVLDVIELVAGFSIVALQMRLGTDPVG